MAVSERDYRIVYLIDEDRRAILIVKVGQRADVYRS
jgi:mRNA-degrading endonuclease RelE of RelBE toxin-antitoxin system